MNEQVNPDMIVLARQSRGLTQRELAKELKVTQGMISKIESGFLNVSETLLSELSKVLKYPPKFFYQEYKIYPAEIGFYRKHKTLPSKILEEVVAAMNIRRAHIEELLEEAEIEFKALPECDVDRYGSPEEVARAIRQYLSLPRGPIENLTKILEDSGVIVIPCDFGTRLFSAISFPIAKPNYFILVNDSMPGDRLRFTLAHELGHIVMHRLPTPDIEEEADRFAAEFLMPTQEIRPHLSNVTLERLANLKKYWKTSMASIISKAKSVGKITENQYRYLWTQMGKAGYRLREPIDIPQEKPTLLADLISVHLREFGYGVDKLTDILILEKEDFTKLYATNGRHLRLASETQRKQKAG